MFRNWKLLTAAAVITGVAAGGIGIARAVGNDGDSHVTPVITVAATNATLKVDGDGAVRPGWTRITDTNATTANHALGVWRLRDGATIEQLRKGLDSPDGLPALKLIDAYGGVDAVEPHATFAMTVRLDPGRYVIVDVGQGPKGPDGPAWFTEPGFIHTFEVAGKATSARPPVATSTIVARDYHYEMPPTLARGGTVEVRNEGSELHMAAMLRLNPGATMAEALEDLQQGKRPPGVQLELFGDVSPGRTMYFDYNLTPANYVIACMMPSASHGGTPHVGLGMVTQFAVR